jgi:hypothetical protein
MDDTRIPLLLAIWICTAAILAIGRTYRKLSATGLTLAYVLNFAMIHWVASVLYLLPSYRNYDPRIIELGLEQSTFGIIAFAIGSVALAPFLLSFGVLPRAAAQDTVDGRLPRAYLILGIGSYVILTTALGSLPTAQAIFSSGQQLIVVGLGLCCWQSFRAKDHRKFALWLFLTGLLPFGTVVTRGFLGYGTVAALSVMIFVSSFVKNKVKVTVAAVLLAFVGLSVYVTYMRDRDIIRESVWGGQSFGDRLAQVQNTFSNFEWFDPSNDQHLTTVDLRLNQNFLAGLAVSRLDETRDYASGATFWDSMLALIPRALWPDKPQQAGSGNLVSQYTGLAFAAGTSVGIGHVMEFYVNFGTTGVVVGFLIMGTLLAMLDQAAAERLAVNDLHGFVLWYLPGISLLQVGGSLVEVTSSAAGSLIAALIANRYLDHMRHKKLPLIAAPVVRLTMRRG